MMAFIVLLSTVELGYLIVKDIMEEPRYFIEIDQLLEIFGFFLLILIGVELLESMKAYLAKKVVHSETVLEVALIAISRKVIILNIDEYKSTILLGIAALIIAISASYFLIRRLDCKTRIDSF
jgi:uncharacterized membrane protein (DUF373 family)